MHFKHDLWYFCGQEAFFFDFGVFCGTPYRSCGTCSASPPSEPELVMEVGEIRQLDERENNKIKFVV
jgi:hypothetical protein